MDPHVPAGHVDFLDEEAEQGLYLVEVVVALVSADNLSYRDVEELLVERGVEVDHVTVFRWVQQNLRRGHYELAVAVPGSERVAAMFAALALAI